MVVAGAAYASCGISDRVTFHHSECVHGWWDNNDWPRKSTFGAQVQNDCHLWGTVVVKVDLASLTLGQDVAHHKRQWRGGAKGLPKSAS